MNTPDLPAFMADLDQRFPEPVPVPLPPILPATPSGQLPPPPPAPAQPPPPVVGSGPPWVQQPGEPDRDFGRFRLYLHMGERGSDGLPKMRSLKNLADQLPLSSETVYRLSSRWQWNARCSAWDAAQRDRPQTPETEVTDVARRLVRVVKAGVAGLEATIAEGKDPFLKADGTQDVKSLGNLLTQMNIAQRLNAGLSTANESRHLTTTNGELAPGLTFAALMDSMRASPLGTAFLVEATRRVLAGSVDAPASFASERVKHFEMLARLFPYEKRHIPEQQQLLRAALYALQPGPAKQAVL